MTLYCSFQKSESSSILEVDLKGHWTVGSVSEIKKSLSLIPFQGKDKIHLKGSALKDLDTSAALCLYELIERFKKINIDVSLTGFHKNHHRIYKRVSGLVLEEKKSPQKTFSFYAFISFFGSFFDSLLKDIYRGTSFIGAFLSQFLVAFICFKDLRLRSVVFHINEVGIKAIPIIALMSFSIAFVTGYQGAFQLEKFDAAIYTVDLVVLSTLREMGVLITAIMVAGRSGSAFAAQLGTMKLNEEVDALQTMGLSPFNVLVMPRLIAIILALPLLTVIADAMGLLGGYIFSSSYLGYSYVQFLSRMKEVADLQQFYLGLLKAPVFALLIGVVGCMQGLQAKGSAEDVGRKTIKSVVQSIFLVIVMDAVFSIIFTKMGV